MFNPETVEHHRIEGTAFVKATDYDLLLSRYREAIDSLVGMVASTSDAMTVLHKAGLTKAKIVEMKTGSR